MLHRSRVALFSWAAAFVGLFVLIGLLTRQDRTPFDRVDSWGRDLESWASDQGWLNAPLHIVEVVFGTVGMTIITILIALALLRSQRRASAYLVAVMLATAIITSLTKSAFGRVRPEWQHPERLLANGAYPSGHASAAAAMAGVLMVLAALYLRRANMRRLVYGAALPLVFLVGADRLLLGRHFPSDVVGGVCLGFGVALLALALFDPLPRRHPVAAEPLQPSGAPVAKREVAVVLNPIKVEDVAAFRSTVMTMAVESGWAKPTWHYTTIEDPGAGMAEAAAVSGADLVLVCGGDGTVREVCAELAGTGIPVGIIPAGTGNLLARNLAIPLFLRSAIDVALNGQDRAIDLVNVSGDGFEDTHFMVMAGMGLDAAIMEGVNDEIKKRVGWLAYVLSGAKALMSPVVKVEISIDGGEFTTHRARTVVVGNVGYLQAGMPLLPDAAIDDGILDVVLLHPKRFLSWLPLAARVIAKRQRTDETIERMTGREVVIRAAADTPRQLDGDTIGPGTELRCECIHGRLLVRVPR